MYIFGAPLSRRGLVWYLLNSWKARASRGLDNKVFCNATLNTDFYFQVRFKWLENKGPDPLGCFYEYFPIKPLKIALYSSAEGHGYNCFYKLICPSLAEVQEKPIFPKISCFNFSNVVFSYLKISIFIINYTWSIIIFLD